MSVSEVLDKYIQKQVSAGNEDFAYRLAEYSGQHHDSDGFSHTYDDMDEFSAPQEIKDRFYAWLQDDHHSLHHDDDRDLLWDEFLDELILQQDQENSQEMAYWKGGYDAEKKNAPVEMPREDMPDKMRIREDLGMDSFASKDFKQILAKYINYDLIQKDSEEKGKTQWEDSRKEWNNKRDKELGSESRKTKRNSELEETESQEHSTIKEATLWNRRLARWAGWKKKNTRTASKDVWVQALDIVHSGIALCPLDQTPLVFKKKHFSANCTKCAYRTSIDKIATDIMTNQIKKESTLNTMISKYANLSAENKPYNDIFNGRVQNNWEDMLGRWDKYIGPDYGVSRAPKKNPCAEDEFINVPSATASSDLKKMLQKYAQQEQWDDFDTQIHPEEDSRADQYDSELQNVNHVEELYNEYGRHYHSEELKRAFKEGLQVGMRGY